MEAENMNLVNTGKISVVTDNLRNRITEIKQSIKELNQFFTTNKYQCPQCNHHTLLMTPSASAQSENNENRSIEFTCEKCGFSETVL